ncbi:MAG TPA: c-type cytochrome [Steroidobacteraceae bacterium]|jgi:cytochrome c553
MRRILKWLGIGVATIAAVALVAVLYLFVASQRIIARTYPIPPSSFDAPSDSTSVRKGARLATIYGCNNCHGQDMAGTVLFDEPGIARISAPNLTAIVKDYTDGELERLVRRGVKRDGTSTWIMPSQMFAHLTDADLGAIIAYVRSVPQRAGVARETSIRPLGRIGILTGQFKPVATEIPAAPLRTDADNSDPLAHGKYLVMTACTECHGANLEGSDFLQAPNLLAAAAYTNDDFFRLMRTGVGIGNRNLGLMTEVAAARFAAFTDDEVAAVRTYLDAFARQGGTSLP